MPRDIGTGIYTYPSGTPGNPGQTVFSARYNTFINDLSNTLNQKLPINMGGTGADNAVEARENLQAEVAGVQVTNYDSHVWETGSFWSQDSAIGSPVAAQLAGHCIVLNDDPNYISLVARNMTTGIVYIRQKTGGSWAAWINESNTWVNVTGDTMTGDLTVGSGNVISKSPSGTDPSHFIFQNSAAVTKGLVYYDFINGFLTLRNVASGIVEVIVQPNGVVGLGNGMKTKAGLSGSYGINSHTFNWSGGATQCWVDDLNTGNITVTSDYRIKKDVTNLPGMWDTVKALRPIKYTQADFDPPVAIKSGGKDYKPMFVADSIERWGFLAHELQETTVDSAASCAKDAPDAIQSLNLAPVVAALARCIQEAQIRIEGLEERLALVEGRSLP